MRMILTGIVLAIAVAVGAGYVLRAQQEPAWQVFSSESTRVGDPGNNLVGQNWTGEPGDGSGLHQGLPIRRRRGRYGYRCPTRRRPGRWPPARGG